MPRKAKLPVQPTESSSLQGKPKSMSTFNPTDLLNKPMADIKPPPPHPLGSFLMVPAKYVFDKTKPTQQGKEPTDVVRFDLMYREALPDAMNDEEAFTLWLDGQSVSDKEYNRSLDFFITPNAVYRLKEFIENDCKVTGAASLNEGLEAVIGQPFIAVFTQVNNPKDPSKPYVNLTSTAPVPD